MKINSSVDILKPTSRLKLNTRVIQATYKTVKKLR